MARPTKLTPESQEIIVNALRLGATYEAAANAAGVSYKTFNEWRKDGENAKSGIKREFRDAILKATAERQLRWLSMIEKAASEGTWQAAAWKLERTHPEQFARQYVRNEQTGKDGGPIEIVVRYVDVDYN